MKELIVSAPGKLMLAGEWAVLENNIPCIVMAIDKRIHASIQELESKENETKIILTAKDVGLTELKVYFKENMIEWFNALEEEKEKAVFAGKAIESSLNYIKEKGIKTKSFKIETKSEISVIELEDGRKEKIGFGSSAATTTAIVSAILKLHGIGINSMKEKEIVYKISAIAHYLAQGKIGSGFDLAASVFGGTIVYQRFNAEWLMKEIKEKTLREVIESEWPEFKVERLELPANFKLLVGFTGKGASTKELVLKIRELKKEQPEEYWKIINGIKEIVIQLIKALKEENQDKILELIRLNRVKLKELSNKSNAGLETEKLKELIETANNLGAAAKFSGAGGGDNGIAICFNEKTAEKIKEKWEKEKIYFLNVKIAREGIRTEK